MSAPSSVAVVGGGRMGAGIAHAFLMAGARVQLCEVDDAAVARALDSVRASVERAHIRGALEDPDVALARMSGLVGLDGFGDVVLVVEAVPEVPALKESVLAQVSARVPPDVVIATNTSSISVSSLSAVVDQPERFLGMHFFNPVPVSTLVEIVRADRTSQATLDLAVEWTTAIKKGSIVVSDAPGFATSRLGVVIGLEAIRMLEEGVAPAEDIDRGMILGYGFPVGPLRLTDIIGLDVRLEIAEYLETQLGERFTPPALLRRKVAAGELGRKSGQGFYDWSQDPTGS